MMKIKTDRLQVMAVTALVVLLLALAALGLVGQAESRTAPWECLAGHVCHGLQGPGSELYLLCAGADGQPGKFRLTSNGADSWYIECMGRVEWQ